MLYLKILLKITPNTLPIVSPLVDKEGERENTTPLIPVPGSFIEVNGPLWGDWPGKPSDFCRWPEGEKGGEKSPRTVLGSFKYCPAPSSASDRKPSPFQQFPTAAHQ